MGIDCIIQARLGSTRLHGKVLKEIKGKTLIKYCLDQISKSKLIRRVIVEGTTNPNDAPLNEKVKEYGFEVFAGSENDVLDRYYQAAKKFNSEIIVRVTYDCPSIDPTIVDKVIQTFIEEKVDYGNNVQPPSFPDGFDVEVFTFDVLERSWKEAKMKSEKEHGTLYIWKYQEKFKMIIVLNDEILSHLGITVSETEDFELVSKIIESIDKEILYFEDIKEPLNINPELLILNSKYSRNEGMAKSIREDEIENEKMNEG